MDRRPAMCRSTIDRAPPTTIYCAATRPKSLALRPDVVLTSGATITASLQRASRTVPIVFVNVTDPVGAGLVASLARPGGNATGFTQFEFGISAKWLELLKEIAPRVTRVGGHSRPYGRTGGRPIRRDPGGGAVARGGRAARSTRATPTRSSAALAAFARDVERRPDRDFEQAWRGCIAS